MATPFLSTVNNPFFSSSNPSPSPSSPSSSSSSSSSYSSSLSIPALAYHHKHQNPKRQLCKAFSESSELSSPVLTKRSFSVTFLSGILFSLAGKGCWDANAAILEADDDVELLEKVKKDRKKRLEKQGVINSSKKETGYLQDLVYRLSKTGQAIENNDLSMAGSVLGGSTDADWVKKANLAFTKLSSSPEEKTEVDTFNSSLASLISSVTKKDVESSKLAFVASASAFEKWTSLTGLTGELKGL